MPQRREYVMETGLFADIALVKAWKADEFGNLVYRKTSRNFNPMMAAAAAVLAAAAAAVLAVKVVVHPMPYLFITMVQYLPLQTAS